jgi:hypothetical protein
MPVKNENIKLNFIGQNSTKCLAFLLHMHGVNTEIRILKARAMDLIGILSS